MLKILKKLFCTVFDITFPKICLLCGIKNSANLCNFCAAELPKLSQCHEIYASPTIALFHYENPIDYLITELKFNKKLAHANLLGNLLAIHLAEYYKNHTKPEIIIPIPLHKKRLHERGFNQALEIAKPISKILTIPLDKASVIRVKNTKMQATLRKKDRKKNVKKAFFAKTSLNYTHVALIDDVVTTGNTMTECIKALKNAGVLKIDIWCVARAKRLL
jgi:ComF family protein